MFATQAQDLSSDLSHLQKKPGTSGTPALERGVERGHRRTLGALWHAVQRRQQTPGSLRDPFSEAVEITEDPGAELCPRAKKAHPTHVHKHIDYK